MHRHSLQSLSGSWKKYEMHVLCAYGGGTNMRGTITAAPVWAGNTVKYKCFVHVKGATNIWGLIIVDPL